MTAPGALEAIRFVDPQSTGHLVAWRAAPFFIPVWLSLFSSGVSMLVGTGRFAPASSQENCATMMS